MDFPRNMKRGSSQFDDLLVSPGYPGMKRPRTADKLETRLLIPSKVAGSIIGRGGSKIQQLRADNDANVRVPDCPGPERVMTINTEDSSTAIKVIEQAIPYMTEEDIGPLEIRLLIHDSIVGGVIGRAGAKIKEIRAESGAAIRVYATCAPQSTERCVSVLGSDEKIIAALEIIMEIVKSNEIRGDDILYDPNNFDGIYADEYGGYGTEADIFGYVGGGIPPRSSQRGRGKRNFGNRGFGVSKEDSFDQGQGNLGAFSSGMGGGAMNAFGEHAFGVGNYSRGKGMVANGGFGKGVGGFGGNAMSGLGSNLMSRFGGAGNTMGGLGNPMCGMGINTMGGMGGGTSTTGGVDIVSGPVETTKVTIPNNLAGAIIGSGGSRIRQIRLESKAKIEIGEPDETSGERIISIAGNEQNIQLAQYLLQQAVRGNGASAGSNF